jgi:small ubiquitin-related modifier
MAAFDASRLSIHNSSSSSNAQDQQQQQQQQQQNQQHSKRPCNNSAAAATQQLPGSAEVLTIVVENHMRAQVLFKMRSSATLGKVFAAYEQRMRAAHPGDEPPHYYFLFDGQRVFSNDTPAALGMEDGDTIDAMLEQLGD